MQLEFFFENFDQKFTKINLFKFLLHRTLLPPLLGIGNMPICLITISFDPWQFGQSAIALVENVRFEFVDGDRVLAVQRADDAGGVGR